MSQVTYDTSVFIAYKPVSFPTGFLLSAVVLQELTAGASDKSELQALEAILHAYEKRGRLLVPSGEDWWLAGKILNSLLRGSRSRRSGRIPKLAPADKQRIIRDVLIARTARRAGALLVTDNVADFKQIKRFCDVRIISGKDFFT